MRISTRTITNIALLTAISIILTRLFGIMVPIAGVLAIRLSFGDIPIMLSGILFGPAAGAVTGVAADLIGYSLFAMGGPFFPGFTLSAALTGIIPALILRRAPEQNLGFGRLLMAVVVTDVIVSVILNTLWLSIMYNKAIIVLLPPRVAARALLVPTHTAIMYAILRHYWALQKKAAGVQTHASV